MGDVFSDVAVLIPCYNEEVTVAAVVKGFQSSLPGAHIYVYDNCSTDNTAEAAKQAGAIVRFCLTPGKGAVVKQMFEEVEEARILMVDGDNTYHPSYARMLLSRLSGHDMVIGDRLTYGYDEIGRRFGHGFGNWLVRFLVNVLFDGDITDVMTGYRAFTKEFVKSVKLTKDHFEVETEMTIWSLIHKQRIASVPIMYKDRRDAGKSKVHTVRDGFRVLRFIVQAWFGFLRSQD